ncbi:hypothetical protein LCGC14_2144130 [marine sediment metagenome]|uniref:Uncharacterized protein n=1 Tax=marine sediment metagenome TaxID=412755 RepID=A0A0F9GAF9_9ZZZZ
MNIGESIIDLFIRYYLLLAKYILHIYMKIFDVKAINHLILEKQHLSEDSKSDNILEIVEDLCGLHATGTLEPYIQLFIRMNQFSKNDLDIQLYNKKTLGRVRGMRKTLFILTENLISIVHTATKYLWERYKQKLLDHLKISKEEYKKILERIFCCLIF